MCRHFDEDYGIATRVARYHNVYGEYGTYDGDIKILNENGTKKIIKSSKFTKNIKEIEDPYRAAKSAELDHQPFMVGAIARINNNHGQLNSLAKGDAINLV